MLLRRFSRSIVSLAVPLAALYGVEPAMAHHMLGVMIGPFRSVADLVLRAH